MAEHINNYVLGRGKVYFDQFQDNINLVGTGERYLGNTPALTMTSTYQNLDHYSSDFGIREKDASVQLQLDRTGSFQADDISIENVAMMFGTSATTQIQAGATAVGERIPSVTEGLYYQLGVDDDHPAGIGEISNVAVFDGTGVQATGTVNFGVNPAAGDSVTIAGTQIDFVTGAPLTALEVQIGATATITAQGFLAAVNSGNFPVTASGAGTTITLTADVAGTAGNAITLASAGAGTTEPTVSGATLTGGTNGAVVPAAGNWEIDLGRARLHILDAATGIINGQALDVTYNIVAEEHVIVIDEGMEVQGALRFIADNPEGTDKDYYWPRVKITPSGDYALKGDTWQVMTMNFEVLKKGNLKRVYVREVAQAA